MNTLVLWYESKNGTQGPLEVDLHFNLWKIKRKKPLKDIFKNSYDYILDFGIMISDINKVDKIFIYVPDILSTENVFDIGKVLQSNLGVLRSVFNEEYISSPISKNPKIHSVKNHSGEIQFDLYRLDISQDVVFNKFNADDCDGTILEIKNNINFNDSEKVYFRLRLTSKFVENISHKHVPASSILENFITNTEIVDFRLNENRNIPISLIEKMKMSSEFTFRKIHFLILRNIKDDFLFSNQQIHNSRELEKKIWNEYVSEKEYKYDQILAYHFKLNSNLSKSNDFNLLVKFRYDKSGISTIFKSLLILFFINTIYEILANIISDHGGRRIIVAVVKYLLSLISINV